MSTIDHLLPPPSKHADRIGCGICETVKKTIRLSDSAELLVCPHCDVPCVVPPTESCGVCRAGMKGLSERSDNPWKD